MKKVEAIIRPEKLSVVRHALEKVSAAGIMITEVEGHGRQKGVTQQWRGEDFKVELLLKTKIEVVVKDSEVEQVIKTIIENARTGEIGDGKIFVYHIEEVVKIRTGEKGEAAI